MGHSAMSAERSYQSKLRQRFGSAVGPPALPGAGAIVEKLSGEQLGFLSCHRPSTRWTTAPSPSRYTTRTSLTGTPIREPMIVVE
jgi:hypothetical protein